MLETRHGDTKLGNIEKQNPTQASSERRAHPQWRAQGTVSHAARVESSHREERRPQEDVHRRQGIHEA
ncbi:MAG TPA: hypothetical protein VIM73_13995 [Polyangiaceae bacterium]